MSSQLESQTSIDSTRSNTKPGKTLRKSYTQRIRLRLRSCWRSTSYTLKSSLNNMQPCMIAENTLTYGESIWSTLMKHYKQINLVTTSQCFSVESQHQFISMSNTLIWSVLGSMIINSLMRISTMKISKVSTFANKHRALPLLRLSKSN